MRFFLCVVAAGLLAAEVTEHTDADVADPATPSYRVLVTLDPRSAQVISGAPGTARISVAPRSLASRLYSYLSRTFAN